MHLADFFIGKPGPGCLSEAIHMGLPVIIEHNHRTLLQERFNATWVKQREVGIVVRSFSQIDKAVQSLLREQRLEAFRDNVRRLNNRALYEIPNLLEQIIWESQKANAQMDLAAVAAKRSVHAAMMPAELSPGQVDNTP